MLTLGDLRKKLAESSDTVGIELEGATLQVIVDPMELRHPRNYVLKISNLSLSELEQTLLSLVNISGPGRVEKL